jgi:hypothetical protein
MHRIRREFAGGARTMTCFTGSKLPVAMNARLYASMVAASFTGSSSTRRAKARCGLLRRADEW